MAILLRRSNHDLVSDRCHQIGCSSYCQSYNGSNRTRFPRPRASPTIFYSTEGLDSLPISGQVTWTSSVLVCFNPGRFSNLIMIALPHHPRSPLMVPSLVCLFDLRIESDRPPGCTSSRCARSSDALVPFSVH